MFRPHRHRPRNPYDRSESNPTAAMMLSVVGSGISGICVVEFGRRKGDIHVTSTFSNSLLLASCLSPARRFYLLDVCQLLMVTSSTEPMPLDSAKPSMPQHAPNHIRDALSPESHKPAPREKGKSADSKNISSGNLGESRKFLHGGSGLCAQTCNSSVIGEDVLRRRGRCPDGGKPNKATLPREMLPESVFLACGKGFFDGAEVIGDGTKPLRLRRSRKTFVSSVGRLYKAAGGVPARRCDVSCGRGDEARSRNHPHAQFRTGQGGV